MTVAPAPAPSSILPHGNARPALQFPHFPTRQQAFIWRNWGLLPAARLAKVLGTDPDEVKAAARALGLKAPDADAAIEKIWLQRGFVTLIRRNWHLLPYPQLLQLLDWTEERMAHALKEEDFLWTKLGALKPQCEPLEWKKLTPAEEGQTAQIREWLLRYDTDCGDISTETPFSFIGRHGTYSATAKRSNSTRFSLRLGYAFSTLYGDPLLTPDNSFFPDEELAAMRTWGINAVWMQAILYQLYPWDVAPELSKGWEKRLETLRDLVARAKRHGIQVYLYLNEPRCLPARLFNENPRLASLRGIDYPALGTTGLCTSCPEVLDFLREGCRHVFREVAGLGGVFTISYSENATSCHSKYRGSECPRCSSRTIPEVVAEVNRTIAESIHSIAPDARVIVWDWAWGAVGGDLKPQLAFDTVALLPDDVELMVTSGFLMPVIFCGVQGLVSDYSISQPGPGEHITALIRQAIQRGLKVHAKLQVNNSWECSVVPYIPSVDLVEQHLRQLRQEGVEGIMYGWTLGGYLGGNIGLLESTPDELAEAYGGPKFGPLLREAWKRWSSAFAEFPYTGALVYRGPSNAGPSNLLFLTPTGYSPTMVGYPYDAVEEWNGAFSSQILGFQFEKASTMWGEALEWLAAAVAEIKEPIPSAVADQLRVAEAVYCNLRSSALQIRFLRMRNESVAKHAARRVTILDEEISLAQRQLRLVRQDSRIGYEPTNHYLFTANDLQEKIINCLHLKSELLGGAG